MSELIGFCTALAERVSKANVRFLVVAEGPLNWGINIASQFASVHGHTLWAGESAPSELTSIPLKKAKKWLGQECNFLVYNAHQGVDVEALGALSGTVTGGGGMLLLLPPSCREGDESALPSVRRLMSLLSSPEVLWLEPDKALPSLPEFASTCSLYRDTEFGCLNDEQYQAVCAIRRVVTGHRKRPLVLTADRGRGKSSALGIAAASLMSERRLRIGVTAPSYANADTLFFHTSRCLGLDYHQQRKLEHDKSQIEFFAPDYLLAKDVCLDFLIVDEAAAIPAPILTRLLNQYNRIAFASTIHGYEGTGRGFAIKFRQQLDVIAPQWRQLQMSQPIRWAEQDPLELWTFKALLLDADYPSVDADKIAKESIRYLCISTETLLSDEVLLSQVFGLLVNAHYQTSPSDLSQLLDDEFVQLVVAMADDVVVGCCLLSIEGGFSSELAQEITLGKRRMRGHLLPQSVAAHVAIAEAATQRCARIMRIAVHPELQQRGIGLAILDYCQCWAEEKQLDYLGTSFGLVPELFDFWNRAGYCPIRLGVTKDAASGAHSLLTVLPLSAAASNWLDAAEHIFSFNFQAQRVEQFRELAPELFIKLFQRTVKSEPSSNGAEMEIISRQLEVYADGGLGYDLVIASIQSRLEALLAQHSVEVSPLLSLAVAKVLQRQSWEKVISDYGFVSRKMAERALRDWVSSQLLVRLT
ncbi:tRNA(Met) cytidine acetyltransferase TmcA [Photobacterium sp. J15]|uniref:tRNA(Met) cytidine acetyltransferase TmcA n=1 Tax=Photobacterium sp. J15 TaxID=265901 RepID=UPI0007E35976|nr:GNAT family N-acetyltransferase [Photobacterium sp. J15]